MASYIIDTWRKNDQIISNTIPKLFAEVETTVEISDQLSDIVGSHLYRFIRLFNDSSKKYSIWKKIKYPLERFIRGCSQYVYHRAEVLGNEYYQGNGGYINDSHFLFGQASQFRMNPG